MVKYDKEKRDWSIKNSQELRVNPHNVESMRTV